MQHGYVGHVWGQSLTRFNPLDYVFIITSKIASSRCHSKVVASGEVYITGTEAALPLGLLAIYTGHDHYLSVDVRDDDISVLPGISEVALQDR